ncbi:MAG: ABC transporter ATP-binding protein [Candidatus Aminicenantes bacterium]|nr:MAG: ABC transporter ATP-binding protein [Candidatus Aminicenantes bacterium]
MSETVIRTAKLGRDFKTVTALDALDLEVPAGIVFGFLGPNGAGKTTMIRLLLGLLEPTRGRAEVLGRDVASHGPEIRALSGALLEQNGLYERLSAADNLEYYGRIWRLSEADRRARIRELLTHFGLWDRRAEQAGLWSRGMKQKLAVARTLLHRPSLVFLDEPTAGLDPVAAASLRDDLSGLAAREGTTIFLTTHNLDEAERLCHRVAIIRAGRLLAEGPVEELKRGPTAPATDVRGSGFTPAVIESVGALAGVDRVDSADGRLTVYWKEASGTSALLRALVDGGAVVDELTARKATFEDAFLKLVKNETQEGPSCSAI